MDWFQYDNGLRHERVNLIVKRYIGIFESSNNAEVYALIAAT